MNLKKNLNKYERKKLKNYPSTKLKAQNFYFQNDSFEMSVSNFFSYVGRYKVCCVIPVDSLDSDIRKSVNWHGTLPDQNVGSSYHGFRVKIDRRKRAFVRWEEVVGGDGANTVWVRLNIII